MPFSWNLDFAFTVLLWNFPDFGPVCVISAEITDLALDDYWSTTKLFFDVSAMTWCGRGLLVNIFFIMYFFTWRDVGGDYWSIFFIMVDKKVIFFKDYLSIFFFFRQTWLRGPHAAPTIEGYWLIKKRIASRTCERQHSRHVFVAHVHEACACAQGEYRVSAHPA